jgi:hypothetical protein
VPERCDQGGQRGQTLNGQWLRDGRIHPVGEILGEPAGPEGTAVTDEHAPGTRSAVPLIENGNSLADQRVKRVRDDE